MNIKFQLSQMRFIMDSAIMMSVHSTQWVILLQLCQLFAQVPLVRFTVSQDGDLAGLLFITTKAILTKLSKAWANTV